MPTPPEYCLFWIDWWPLCMQRSDWASWVQAIGSLLALGITIGIWLFEATKSSRNAVTLLDQTALMIEGGMAVAIDVAGGLDESRRRQVGDNLREHLRLIRSIDVGQLDLQRAILLSNFCATTQTFCDVFDRQNESVSIAVAHCRVSLSPMLADIRGLIKTLLEFD